MKVHGDCITHCITTDSPLPIGYIVKDANQVIGCAGLVSNDFISHIPGYVHVLFISKKL